MTTGKTRTGYEYEFNEDLINDMEVIDALADVTSGENVLALSAVMKKLFAPDERAKLYDHVRTEDGRVPTDALMEEIRDIMEGADEGKKS